MRHPDVHKKILVELDNISTDLCYKFSHDDFDKLPYLNQVINESMRLWPVVPLGVGREAAVDYVFGDVVVPKGANVTIPFYVLFRTGITVST